jgi:hypothetical protein
MPSVPEVPSQPLLCRDRASTNLQTMSLLRSVGEDVPILSADVETRMDAQKGRCFWDIME